MADIKQAAIWMRKGKAVRRESWGNRMPISSWISSGEEDFIVLLADTKEPEIVNLDDLLAEDWVRDDSSGS